MRVPKVLLHPPKRWIFGQKNGRIWLKTGIFGQISAFMAHLTDGQTKKTIRKSCLQTKENVMLLFKAAFMWSKKYSDTHHQPLKEVLSPFLVYIQVLTSSICHYDTISHTTMVLQWYSSQTEILSMSFNFISFCFIKILC